MSKRNIDLAMDAQSYISKIFNENGTKKKTLCTCYVESDICHRWCHTVHWILLMRHNLSPSKMK